MRANVLGGVNKFGIEDVKKPRAQVGEAVVRVTLTTICGTDLHIVRGEFPVKPGLVIGHKHVGTIEELGLGVDGFKVGDRVLVGAITPCGQCRACLSGHLRPKRVDLSPLLTHRFSLDDIQQAYALFGERQQGVLPRGNRRMYVVAAQHLFSGCFS